MLQKTACEKPPINGFDYVPIKRYSKRHYIEVSIVVHVCSINTQEAETGGLHNIEARSNYMMNLMSVWATVCLFIINK